MMKLTIEAVIPGPSRPIAAASTTTMSVTKPIVIGSSSDRKGRKHSVTTIGPAIAST